MSDFIAYNNRGETVSVSSLTANETDEAACLYRTVSINSDNYTDCLSATGQKPFDKFGGMFIIQTAGSIRTLLSEGERFLIARQNGNAVGLVWIPSVKATHGLYRAYSFFDSKTEQLLTSKVKAGVVADGGEIIVVSGNGFRGLSSLLMYENFRELKDNGYEYTTGYFYEVKSYTDINGTVQTDLVNNASKNVMLRIGGEIVAESKIKTVDLPGFTVKLKSHLILWNLDRSLAVMREQLAKQDIKTEGQTI